MTGTWKIRAGLSPLCLSLSVCHTDSAVAVSSKFAFRALASVAAVGLFAQLVCGFVVSQLGKG